MICIHFPSTFLLSRLTHKQLFCILLPSTLVSLFLTLCNCSASLFHHLFFSLLTLNNCSASLFPHLFFSLSNSKQLLFIFFNSTLLLCPYSKHLLCILVPSNLFLSSYSNQLLNILNPSTFLLFFSPSKQLLCILVHQLFLSLLTLCYFSASLFP